MGMIGSCVFRAADAGELPTSRRWEEVAVAHAHVRARGRARTTAQHHLIAHELAVVFAERPRQGLEARVGRVCAGGPLPGVAEHLRVAWVTGSTRVQLLAVEE